MSLLLDKGLGRVQARPPPDVDTSLVALIISDSLKYRNCVFRTSVKIAKIGNYFQIYPDSQKGFILGRPSGACV